VRSSARALERAVATPPPPELTRAMLASCSDADSFSIRIRVGSRKTKRALRLESKPFCRRSRTARVGTFRAVTMYGCVTTPNQAQRG
jgi:hypothetical protein